MLTKWVSQVTLSRTGFGGHVKALVFSKTVRNLAYNEHVALSHLLSAGHGLALGYNGKGRERKNSLFAGSPT